MIGNLPPNFEADTFISMNPPTSRRYSIIISRFIFRERIARHCSCTQLVGDVSPDAGVRKHELTA